MEATVESLESIPESDLEIQLHQEPGQWKTVELILEAVFKFLTIEDLKNARLVSKKWCSVGTFSLASRAIVRLSNQIFEAAVPPIDDDESSVLRGDERANFVTYDDNSRWLKFLHGNAPGKRVKFYTTLKVYVSDKVWDSGFRPKRVSILCCENVWKLPKSQFSAVEELQVVKFKSSEATWLLHQLGTFFPNLKSLELLDLEVKPRPKGCSNCECTCWSRSMQNPDTSMVPAETSKLPLEKLVMDIGPGWNRLPWDVLKRSAKFRVLELNVILNYVRDAGMFGNNQRNQDEIENIYSTCLKDVSENADQLPHLKEVKLSFFSKSDDLENTIVALLNELNLEKLTLEIFWGNIVKLSSLLGRLSFRTMRKLETLCAKLWIEDDREDHLKSFFETLGRLRFFEKDVWDLRINTHNGLRFWKTGRQFVLQSFTSESLPEKVAQILKCTLIPQGHLPNVYNYVFHNFEGYVLEQHRNKIYLKVNDFELYGELRGESFIFNPKLLNPERKSWRLSCDPCLKVPRLLCDLPGFCEEVGIDMKNLNPNHNYDYWPFIRTWTFCQVPEEVMSKWSARLASQRAAAEGGGVCQCPREGQT